MTDDPLLTFFKLFADFRRLQMAGLLATEPLSADALAERIGLTPAEVSKALAPLRQAGLVRLEAGHYRLDRRALEGMARETLKDHRPRPDPDDPLAGYFDQAGRLRTLPASGERLIALLERLAERFEPGRPYAEREVNELLAATYEDYALLRRYLVDAGLLRRTVAVGRAATYERGT